MLITRFIIFFALYNVVDVRYSLYYTDIRQSSYLTFDCLYAHTSDREGYMFGLDIRTEQLTPYCQRLDDSDTREEAEVEIMEGITFNELRKQGVTSEQLLQWSAPIDIVERYEINNESLELFYNCSTPWFGSKCQYRFFYNFSLSFDEILKATIATRTVVSSNVSTITCYRFFANCDRGLWVLCLDWREVCNGQIDCINGEDEQHCQILETSQCNNDEYRCHYGGQCIPRIFLRDARSNVDCLDGSDEQVQEIYYTRQFNYDCTYVSTFQCQERSSRYPREYACGNGQYAVYNVIPMGQMFCSNHRDRQATLAILTSFDHIQDDKCREEFRCLLLSNRTYSVNAYADIIISMEYFEGNWNKSCDALINICANKWLVLPAQPIMYGYFQLVYLTNRSNDEFINNIAPDFVCFHAQKCPSLLSRIIPVDIIPGLTCCHSSDLIGHIDLTSFHDLYRYFSVISFECATTGNESSCENPSYFHCNVSLKCIPYHRVGDGNRDCYYDEDETFSACQFNHTNRFTCDSDKNKCLMFVAVGNSFIECPRGEDEGQMTRYGLYDIIPFPAICNGRYEDLILMKDGNETDETNCEWWPCDHTYVRCNGVWDCPNGMDELNCPYINCSSNEFQCKNNDLNLTYCLPFNQMFYKQIDDCSDNEFIINLYFDNEQNKVNNGYYSFNASKCVNSGEICINYAEKILQQQTVCRLNYYLPISVSSGSVVSKLDENNTYMCTLDGTAVSSYNKPGDFLITRELGYFPPITISSLFSNQQISRSNFDKANIPSIDSTVAWYCHQGILIYSRIKNRKFCLCPPNYFGLQCQWQNQRIGLTLQFKRSIITSATTIFQVIIMLIDDQGIIAPYYEQLTYIPTYQCNTKFNLYLLYPDRPKNLSANYSIHIDLFNKTTSTYWTSWYIPIPYQFLPVNRISTQLIIPEKPSTDELCLLPCGEHGRCIKYTNVKSLYFCQCDQGYFGRFCNQTYTCQCSNDSYCLSPSICVCPLHKFGSSCYLKRSICSSSNNPCQNNEYCIPMDDRLGFDKYLCVCEQGYSGDRCQYKGNEINIYIDDRIPVINSSLLIHSVTAFNGLAKHERTTILKKIPFNQNTITIYVTQPFNILFVQILDGDYYLVVLRETVISKEHIETRILPDQRCLPVADLLNHTVLRYIYLRRIKYYPLICEEYSKLMCFYDEYNMCICDRHRFSNCFTFNTTMKYNCEGNNPCLNDGQCFQNNETCPATYICLCDDCFYGDKCQLTTKGFLFSLDPILGYHIKPNITISQQPFIVKISIAITTLMLISGLIFGSLSIATFQLEKVREVGCGYYLLASSISSLSMIVILTIKFWHLVLTQMLIINNRTILFIGCLSIDIFVKVFLVSSEWLNACVAIERMFNVMKGVHFNSSRSKLIAKRMIIIIILLTILTHIHDPLHRKLIDDLDGDQKRIWCFSEYQSSISIYNSFITIFHFLTPFSINVISSIILIIVAARTRFIVGSNQSLQQHLRIQFKQHKHTIIAPVALIILSLPRLIISFTSGCMRSAREPWLYLIGYFVSFIPSMLTFFVFVLPSTTYKSEFDKLVKRRFRRFHLQS